VSDRAGLAQGETPLLRAVARGHRDVVGRLLAYGADPRWAHTRCGRMKARIWKMTQSRLRNHPIKSGGEPELG
jgi:ankyrin repeat protein